MNKMMFFTISTSLLLAVSGNVPAGKTCMQEGDLFNQKADKVKPLYQKCAESKLNSKACKQYSQEAKKAVVMMNMVVDCGKASGDMSSAVPKSFWYSSKEFSDDLEAHLKRSKLDMMEKM